MEATATEKCFYRLGGTLMTLHTDYTAEALNNCKLTVQISTKLNWSHLATGSWYYQPWKVWKGWENGKHTFLTMESSMAE
jgi:hypothetical protein